MTFSSNETNKIMYIFLTYIITIFSDRRLERAAVHNLNTLLISEKYLYF
jgi:hypothetical protein